MKLAERLKRVKPSATLTLAAKAKEMAARGEDVVSLTAGEPDFDPPAHVLERMREAVLTETSYTAVPGVTELRQAIATRTSVGEITFDAQDVVVTTGAKQAIFNALMATLNPGDEGIVIAPFWLSYGDMIRIAGGDVVTVDTDESTGFVAAAETIAAAITPRTRVIILNSPSNPAGALMNRAQTEALAEVLRRHPDILIISDDIYSRFVYGEAATSILEVAPDLAPRTLIIDGCSKTYAMTGLRIGWGVGPRALIGAMSKLQGQSTSNVCAPAQYAALAAITGDQTPVTKMLQAFDTRRKFVVGRLNAIPHVRCFDPRGAFYVFPNLKDYVGRTLPDGSDVDDTFSLCGHLLHDHGLVVVPGGPFGKPTHIRLSIAADMETLGKGLDRLRTALTSLG